MHIAELELHRKPLPHFQVYKAVCKCQRWD